MWPYVLLLIPNWIICMLVRIHLIHICVHHGRIIMLILAITHIIRHLIIVFLYGLNYCPCFHKSNILRFTYIVVRILNLTLPSFFGLVNFYLFYLLLSSLLCLKFRTKLLILKWVKLNIFKLLKILLGPTVKACTLLSNIL